MDIVGITLFYSKRTGEIVSYSACSTPQSFDDYFGTQAEDMALIYDSVFTDYDKDLFDNMKDYKIIDGKIVKKESEIDVLKKENEAFKVELAETQAIVNELMLMQMRV